MKITNKLKNQKSFLFLYKTSSNEWEIIQEGEFNRNTHLLLKEGIIFTSSHDCNEIVIYERIGAHRYSEVNRRKFTG